METGNMVPYMILTRNTEHTRQYMNNTDYIQTKQKSNTFQSRFVIFYYILFNEQQLRPFYIVFCSPKPVA